MTVVFLRRAALIAIPIGAAGSLGLMLRAGQRSASPVLLILMAIWVLSPFVALLAASVVAKRRPILNGAKLYALTLVLTLSALAIYVYDAFWPRAKAAFVYVIVPMASWILIVITIVIAAVASRAQSRRVGGA